MVVKKRISNKTIMKAELVEHDNNDLSVANIARVSFGNWNYDLNVDKDWKL